MLYLSFGHLNRPGDSSFPYLPSELNLTSVKLFNHLIGMTWLGFNGLSLNLFMYVSFIGNLK